MALIASTAAGGSDEHFASPPFYLLCDLEEKNSHYSGGAHVPLTGKLEQADLRKGSYS